jgi:hypothetical protein
LRIGPLLVPFAHDPGRDYARRGVVGENALHPQVEHIVRIRHFRHRGGGIQARPSEYSLPAPSVRIGTLREGRQIAWQRLEGSLVIFSQTDQVALHGRATVRRIRIPHQQAFAVGGAPVEGTRELLTADQMRGRTTCIIVRHGKIADIRVHQGSKETDGRPWHVGLHGGLYGQIEPLA